MAAAVVADRRAGRLGHGVEVGDEFLHRFGRQLGAVLQRLVEVGHVRRVVLVVVDLHGLRVDVRFERFLGVGQGRQFVRHSKRFRNPLGVRPWGTTTPACRRG